MFHLQFSIFCLYEVAATDGLYYIKHRVFKAFRLCCSYMIAAEQKARTTYDNILRLVKDPEVCDPIRFLREREIVHYQRFGEANREDCSKNSRVLKAHKYSIFGNLLSIRKMQDVGISRPICCYTSKLIRKKEIEQAIFIYNLISTRKAAFLTPTQENRNAAFFMPSCYAVRANKALIYAALKARK